MKAHRSSLFVAALASLALAGCGHGSSSGAGGDVAIVNGEAISMDEYYRYLERKPVVQVEVPQGVQTGQVAELHVPVLLGFQALRDLINRRILLDVARDEKVMPSDDDVNKELTFQRSRQPDLLTRLTSQGLSLEDIKRDLTIDLAKEKIVTKGITVTAADADTYIKGHPEQFMVPEQARLIVVMVKDKAGENQVDTDLTAGKPFQTVAEQYSIDPKVRQTRGIIAINDVAQLPAGLQQLIESTPEGKTTPWQPQAQGFAKVYMDQKIKSKPMTLDANQKEAVRRKLALDRGSAASDLPKRLVDKLRSSKISVNPPSLKNLWDTAYKQLTEQQDMSPTNAPGGASAVPPTAAGTAGPAPTRR